MSNRLFRSELTGYLLLNINQLTIHAYDLEMVNILLSYNRSKLKFLKL
jgi:hypothetical protein